MLPIADAQEPHDVPALYEDSRSLSPLPPGWEDWLIDQPLDNVPALDWDHLAGEASPSTPPMVPVSDLTQDLLTLDRWIEAAQEEMNTPDGWQRLDGLLETRDLVAEELDFQAKPALDLMEAHFMEAVNMDTNGVVAGYSVQYMEVYPNADNTLGGRVLEVGQYETAEAATQVYETLHASLTDGTLAPADLPVLAAELAEANGLPADAWREATPDDHTRFAEQSVDTDTLARDVPSEGLVSDPTFTHTLFTAVTTDPEQADQEQTRLANEQALVALHGIGLTVQPDFKLARDAFYDAERGEHLINGVFQQNPADPTQDCRPMLVSLTTAQDGVGFAAQAVEFGRVGSLAEVQADHDHVQTALEQNGVAAGIAAIETLAADYKIPEEGLSLAPEIAPWSREID